MARRFRARRFRARRGESCQSLRRTHDAFGLWRNDFFFVWPRGARAGGMMRLKESFQRQTTNCKPPLALARPTDRGRRPSPHTLQARRTPFLSNPGAPRRHLSPLNEWRLFMRPRMHVPLSAADRATIALWSRRVLLVWAVIAASLVAYAFLAQREPATANIESPQQQVQSAPRGQQ